ncbi:MAG: hypothetical protein ACNA7L_06010 [Roseinatronobacter sp.]
MSEARTRAAPLAGLVSAVWLALAPAQADTPCHALPNGFEFCAAGTLWQDAEGFDFEGAVVLEGDDLWLEIMPLPDQMADQSLDSMLDNLASEFAQQAMDEGARAPDILDRTRFQTSQMDVIMMTMTEFGNGDDYTVVTAVAQGNGRHLILALDGDAAFSASEMEQTMRNIAELIRPSEEG